MKTFDLTDLELDAGLGDAWRSGRDPEASLAAGRGALPVLGAVTRTAFAATRVIAHRGASGQIKKIFIMPDRGRHLRGL